MSTTGILEAAHVIFYHPLDDFTEHTQSQAWTGSGGFVPGKIGTPPTAVSAITADSFAWGAPTSGTSSAKIHRLAKIDSSRALMAVKDASNQIKVRVCTVSGNDVTVGPEFTALTGPYGADAGLGLAMLDGSKFLVASSSDNVGKCRVGIVSGTDVTLGAAQTFDSEFLPWGACAVALDPSRVAIAYSNYSGGAENGYIIVATVSGTVATFGARTLFGSGLHHSTIGLSRIDSDRAALSWRAGANAYLAVASFSGAAVSYGASAQLASDATNVTRVDTLTASKVVVMYHRAAEAPWVRVGTVSGPAVTVGAETKCHANSLAGGICALDSQTFAVIFWGAYLFNRAAVLKKGAVSGASATFGSASTPWVGDGSNGPEGTFEARAMSDSSVLAAAVPTSSASPQVALGQLGLDAAIAAPTPGAYPTAVGATRVIAAMWARNLTAVPALHRDGRGPRIEMTAASVSLGASTATWSDSGIADLMSSSPGGMNDGDPHLLVLCFGSAGGSDWTLRTSVDGAAWVDQGAQDSGSQAVATSDTAPGVEIADGEPGQWIDELVLWAGDAGALTCFTAEELANLHDLADMFGDPMDQYEENFGAPICWQATARMPDGSAWRDSGCGPCPPVVRVPRGASDVVVTDDGRPASPRVVEG